MFNVVLIVLAGIVIIDVLIEHRQRAGDVDAEDHHRALMREVRRHSRPAADRRLSNRGQ